MTGSRFVYYMSKLGKQKNFIKVGLNEQGHKRNFSHKLTPLLCLYIIGSNLIFIFKKEGQISKLDKAGSN